MNYGILLAGGKGTRLGLPTPKQFLKIGNKTLLEHSVEKFANCPFLKHTVVVVPADWYEQSSALLAKLSFSQVSICLGGRTRQESLYKGLQHLRESFEALGSSIPSAAACSSITSLKFWLFIFIRKASTSPPSPQPKHLKIWREGVTTKEGVFSL